MHLINSEKLDQLKGGSQGTCNKTGDTISCGLLGKIINCKTGELNCIGNFSSSCDKGSFTVSGCTEVTITY